MPRRKIVAPKKIGEVVSELGSLYRDCRNGRTDTLDGSRMASILTAIRQALETSDLEDRIRELETIAEKQRR
jgi:hypothetical protein